MYERQPSQNKIAPTIKITQSSEIDLKQTAINNHQSAVRETIYYEVNPDDIKDYNE